MEGAAKREREREREGKRISITVEAGAESRSDGGGGRGSMGARGVPREERRNWESSEVPRSHMPKRSVVFPNC